MHRDLNFKNSLDIAKETVTKFTRIYLASMEVKFFSI